MKHHGFTLAEVLITLGIIGVVAALTIPTLVSNYQKKTAIVRLKKAYNVLSNAFQASIGENGPITTWDFPTQYLDDTLEENYIFKYTKAEKKSQKSYRLYKPEGGNAGFNRNYYHYITQDGFHYWMYANCARSSADQPRPFCNWAYMFVDIDGVGKRNQLGRDVFVFHINFNNDKTPIVYTNHTSKIENLKKTCASKASGEHLDDYYNGTTCLDLIVRNNWEFPKDYPW